MKKTKTFKFKESVGIDIGTHSVKVVHLKRLHEGFKLLNYVFRPTVPYGVDYIPSDLMPDRYAPVLVEIFKTLRINPKKRTNTIFRRDSFRGLRRSHSCRKPQESRKARARCPLPASGCVGIPNGPSRPSRGVTTWV